MIPWNNVIEYQMHYIEQENRHKRVHTMWFHFYEVVKQAK